MKKILGLLALSIALHGCDDGDLTIQNIDFTTVAANRCPSNNIVYKLKDTEALFFEVADFDALFVNDATPEDNPRSVDINSNNRVFYRAYNGNIDPDNICETVQPATPSVIEEWTFTEGHIEVTTTPVIIGNTELAGGETITGYRHHIVLKETYKNTPGGTEFVETYVFGDYTKQVTPLSFNFGDDLDNCGNLITNINGSEALTLDIEPTLIESAETPAGQPRTGILGTTTNKLTYWLFQTAVNANYFCTTPTPSTPTLLEQWTGDAVTGTIEVTTTSSGPGVFQHEIHLKNVEFRKGNTAFRLADDYFLGFLITN